jgi:hypothetical protein
LQTFNEVIMPLWRRLYNTVWLAFFACVLIPRWLGLAVGMPVHIILGALMVLMTQINFRKLASLPVPARLQRISKATAGFAVFQLICGLALGAAAHFAPNLHWALALLRGVHIVCALAILAQASSVATGYDMWEEKEIGGAAAK